MSDASRTTLDELLSHFSQDAYDKLINACANKRTSGSTLSSIQTRFFPQHHASNQETIQQMSQVGMTRDDLSLLMQYKLSRGKWRPRLQEMIASNGEDLVKQTTLAAFSPPKSDRRQSTPTLPQSSSAADGRGDEETSLEEIARRVTCLTTPLKAVGPATASLILTVMDPSIPFFSDEFAAFHRPLPGQSGSPTVKLKYDLKEYLGRVEAHRDWMAVQRGQRRTGNWSPPSARRVEEMIWYWIRTGGGGDGDGRVGDSEARVAVVDRGKRKRQEESGCPADSNGSGKRKTVEK